MKGLQHAALSIYWDKQKKLLPEALYHNGFELRPKRSFGNFIRIDLKY
jgi:hypothetical protein